MIGDVQSGKLSLVLLQQSRLADFIHKYIVFSALDNRFGAIESSISKLANIKNSYLLIVY